MNTAVRQTQRPINLAQGESLGIFSLHGIYLLAIVLSAIAVIFIANEYRVQFSSMEQLQYQNRQLLIAKHQLLTERTYFSRHDRLKRVAMDSLSMAEPVTIKYID